MNTSKFETLLDGWLAKTLSADEIDDFLKLLHQPGCQQLLESRLEQNLKTSTYVGQTSYHEREKAVERILTGIKEKRSVPKIKKLHLHYWAAAAIFLIMVGFAFFFLNQNSSYNKKYQQITVQNSTEKFKRPTLQRGNGEIITLGIDESSINKGFVATADSIVYSDVSGPEIEAHTLKNPEGYKPFKLVLSDGTRIILNAASSVIFTNHFIGKLREVKLIGEAYFDVAKNKGMPFIVHTERIDVKVLGTAFNIKSYPNELRTQTTLFRGSVEVAVKRQPDRKIILKPNEKLEVSEGEMVDNNRNPDAKSPLLKISLTSSSSTAQNNVNDDILWTKNRLAFDYMELWEVALMIERWYGVTIKIENKSLLNKRFSGVFENRPIDEVLTALQLVGKFDYEKKENLIRIK